MSDYADGGLTYPLEKEERRLLSQFLELLLGIEVISPNTFENLPFYVQPEHEYFEAYDEIVDDYFDVQNWDEKW